MIVASFPSSCLGNHTHDPPALPHLYAAPPSDVAVPDVVGMTWDEAHTALENARFKVDVLEVPNDTVGNGIVAAQLPKAGERVPEGSTVAILVSAGPAMWQLRVRGPGIDRR